MQQPWVPACSKAFAAALAGFDDEEDSDGETGEGDVDSVMVDENESKDDAVADAEREGVEDDKGLRGEGVKLPLPLPDAMLDGLCGLGVIDGGAEALTGDTLKLALADANDDEEAEVSTLGEDAGDTLTLGL